MRAKLSSSRKLRFAGEASTRDATRTRFCNVDSFSRDPISPAAEAGGSTLLESVAAGLQGTMRRQQGRSGGVQKLWPRSKDKKKRATYDQAFKLKVVKDLHMSLLRKRSADWPVELKGLEVPV